MDERAQIEFLQVCLGLDSEDLTQMERIISRIKQGGLFPSSPGGSYRSGYNQYTAQHLIQAWHSECAPEDFSLDDLEEDDLDDDGFLEEDSDFIKIKKCFDTTETIDIKWNMDIEMNTTSHYNGVPIYNSLDCCAQTTAPVPSCVLGYKKKVNQIKEEIPMITENQTKTNYIARRLDDTYYGKDETTYDTFNMRSVRPKNLKQAKEWLAKGGLTVVGNGDEADDTTQYFNTMWQDPEKPRNKAGFEAARILLGKDYQDAKDAIMVKTPEEALAVFKDFEAKVYN